MKLSVLGRTGLNVSVAGLGCGGHSRLGQSTGRSFEESVALVQSAVDMGITYIDTAPAYGTEDNRRCGAGWPAGSSRSLDQDIGVLSGETAARRQDFTTDAAAVPALPSDRLHRRLPRPRGSAGLVRPLPQGARPRTACLCATKA